ncbi:hypothetical protein OG909_08255 [Streptomyces sp. NBC_01754]|nr:hypothetical protein [Streptomyces sp. NBC_01754]WSC96780.1 hypothetical protein OG909_08255 [Streptomyces sp. NBC_01754]
MYDSPGLTPLRHQDSGIRAKRGLWEVHRDPYDVSQIWLRDHRSEGRPWIQATWKQLHRAPVPFGDLAWDHVSHQMRGSTEAEIADAVASLLTRPTPDRRANRSPRRPGATAGSPPGPRRPGRRPHCPLRPLTSPPPHPSRRPRRSSPS